MVSGKCIISEAVDRGAGADAAMLDTGSTNPGTTVDKLLEV
jgi:hypothetical protein